MTAEPATLMMERGATALVRSFINCCIYSNCPSVSHPRGQKKKSDAGRTAFYHRAANESGGGNTRRTTINHSCASLLRFWLPNPLPSIGLDERSSERDGLTLLKSLGFCHTAFYYYLSGPPTLLLYESPRFDQSPLIPVLFFLQ